MMVKMGIFKEIRTQVEKISLPVEEALCQHASHFWLKTGPEIRRNQGTLEKQGISLTNQEPLQGWGLKGKGTLFCFSIGIPTTATNRPRKK